MRVCVVSVMGWGGVSGGGKRGEMKAGDAQASLFFLSPTPNRAGLIFFFFFAMFESRAKSFLQRMDSNIVPSLFLFKDLTSQFDEFEAEIVSVLGKVCACVCCRRWW